MSRYRRIETGTWTDQKVVELSGPQPNGRTLWHYLLTGQRTTIFPGLVIAKPVVMAADLNWSLDGLMSAWAEIDSRGMAIADWVAGVIVLPRALMDRRGAPRETAKPTSSNAFRGWAKAWDDVPDCDLKAWYLAELGRFSAALDRTSGRGKSPDAYLIAYRDAFATPLERVADAYPDAFATRTPGAIINKRRQDVNASPTRLEPTRDPVPVPVPEISLSGDLVGSGSPSSGAFPDPSTESRAERDQAGVVVVAGKWARRRAWWDVLRDTHRRLRVEDRIEPNAPDLPPQCAGANERSVIECVRDLHDSGYSDSEVDAKVRHVIELSATEARRERHLRWFKPAMIFDRSRFSRACDTTLEQAKRKDPKSQSQYDFSAELFDELRELEAKGTKP